MKQELHMFNQLDLCNVNTDLSAFRNINIGPKTHVPG